MTLSTRILSERHARITILDECETYDEEFNIATWVMCVTDANSNVRRAVSLVGVSMLWPRFA